MSSDIVRSTIRLYFALCLSRYNLHTHLRHGRVYYCKSLFEQLHKHLDVSYTLWVR